jgi:hypothetical protein
MAPRDLRESLDLLRREAHQTPWPQLSKMLTESLIRLDEEAHGTKREPRGNDEP